MYQFQRKFTTNGKTWKRVKLRKNLADLTRRFSGKAVACKTGPDLPCPPKAMFTFIAPKLFTLHQMSFD